jgi:hypothetical protein
MMWENGSRLGFQGGSLPEPIWRSSPFASLPQFARPLVPTDSMRWRSIVDWLLWPFAIGGVVWIVAFILFRSAQPYPLDAFEEYELHKALRCKGGAPLYGARSEECFPEAYPPIYFIVLGAWQAWFGKTFLAQRSLSLIAFAGAVGCAFWSLREQRAPNAARVIFIAWFLSLHSMCGRFYEVGKPDMMFTAFLAAAIVTGRHRNTWEAIASSVALWLASLTKQTGPLFILPLALSHFISGRMQWSILWSGMMCTIIGGSYAVATWATDGHFWDWVFVWTAGHGVDFGRGLQETAEKLLHRGPGVLLLLAGLLPRRRSRLWAMCLITTLAIGVLGMSKAGGRESHLLPAAYVASLAAASWFGGLNYWHRDRRARAAAEAGARDMHNVVGRSPNTWARLVKCRWLLAAVTLATLWIGLPSRRDFRWIARRADEVQGWVAAVQELGGRVAVSHHLLLARRAGADCFFSDLILEFRGLEVPASVQQTIAERRYDYIILCDDPRSSATATWPTLIERHYVPAGTLEFPNLSKLLPSRVYRVRDVSH